MLNKSELTLVRVQYWLKEGKPEDKAEAATEHVPLRQVSLQRSRSFPQALPRQVVSAGSSCGVQNRAE